MTGAQVLLALACVVAISVGQLLFKLVGEAINAAGGVFAPRPLLLGAVAVLLYAAATGAWIHLLRSVPLNKAYPWMALCFLLVPLLGHGVLGEKITLAYAAGVALVVAGVVLVTRAA